MFTQEKQLINTFINSKNFIPKSNLPKNSAYTSSEIAFTNSTTETDNNMLMKYYFDNNLLFFISKTTKEIQPSHNYRPKQQKFIKSISQYSSEEETDFIEEIIQTHKNEVIEYEKRTSNTSASSSLNKDSVGNEQNNKYDYIYENNENINSNNNSIFIESKNKYKCYMPIMQPQLMIYPQKPICNNRQDISVKLSPYLIKEQNGSRYLQKLITSDKHFSNETFFSFVKAQHNQNKLTDLICNQFGNYLFQSLIKSITSLKLSEFLYMIENDLYQISINTYGTRVIQKLISVIKNNELLLSQFNIMLKPIVLKLLKESHGNHIIQKFLEEIKTCKHKSFLNKIIEENFVDISTNKYGCCTIQKFISESIDDKEKEHNLQLVKQYICQIIYNQYGSYVFQYVIIQEEAKIKEEILKQLLPNLIKICKTKYSSNAIEKCFEFPFDEIHFLIVNKICENNDNIKELILDPYGNYIIQKALGVCTKQNYDKIISIIGGNINKIRQMNFGSKLITKLLTQHKILGEYITNK